jgi:protocatechuate 3,4-dioxygenase beta subunit
MSFRSKLILNILLFLVFTGFAQEYQSNRLIGGPCEGCEAVFEYGDLKLNPIDTLPDFQDPGMQIKITGTIYKPDGKIPAEGVILYIYHTDQHGIYATRGDEKGWARRHGYIRGWIRTDRGGKYTFYTLKPGTYPDRSSPAHIHPVLLEPDGSYYWLGSYHFAGDPLLTEKEIHPRSPRGGSSGLLELKKEGNLMVGNRDIILGKNVPGYDDR